MLSLIALALAAAPLPALTDANKEVIKSTIGRYLKDPYSAQYEWPAIKNSTTYCGFVNAKNGFGAYEGYQPFLVLYYIGLKTKQLTVVNSEMDPRIVNQLCLEAGYRISR